MNIWISFFICRLHCVLSELSLKTTVLGLFFHFSANNISSKWHPPMSVAAGEVLMENSRISGLSWSYSDQSPQQPAVCIFAAVCINCTHTNYAKLLRTTDPHAATTDPRILISIIMSQKATWYVDIWSSLRLNEWCMACILSTKFSQYSEQQLPSFFLHFRFY